MNQEKEMMQMVSSAGDYTAPKVNVTNARATRVICSSITKMTVSDTEQDDEDFNDN